MLWNLSFQCSWMDFVEESFYLWHSDITSAARHYLIWAYPPSDFLISLQYGLALYDAHIWRSSALPSQAMRSLLKEQTFFGSFSRRSKNAIGLKPTMGGQLLSGTRSGHILGSFRSYFIHNGLWRAEILESEQIFGKSFVHRSREEASWENPQELMSYKSTPLSVLPSWNILSET